MNPDIFADEDFIIRNQRWAEPANNLERPSRIPYQSIVEPTTSSDDSLISL
jgi:hypothetical protein